MFKKITAIAIVAVALIVSLSACGSSDKPAAAPIAKPVVYTGTWNMVDTSNPGFKMTAEVTDNNIEITWVSNDTSALYWKGTFPAPTASASSAKIVSSADTEALSTSLLASQDPSKTFTYDNGVLSFPFTVAGVSKNIHLKK